MSCCKEVRCFHMHHVIPMSIPLHLDILMNSEKQVECTGCCLKLKSKYEDVQLIEEKVTTCCLREESSTEMFNYGSSRQVSNCWCCKDVDGYDDRVKYNIKQRGCALCIDTKPTGFGFYLCCIGYYAGAFKKLWRCCCCESDC